jgi:hypothetical protein
MSNELSNLLAELKEQEALDWGLMCLNKTDQFRHI